MSEESKPKPYQVIVEVPDGGRHFAEEIRAMMQYTISQVSDASDLQKGLEWFVLALYRGMPDGEKNYGENGEVGIIELSRLHRSGWGIVDINYTPSPTYQSKLSCVSIHLGAMNLRMRVFTPRWKKGDYSPYASNYPEVLMKDTEAVMEQAGLEIVDRL